MKTTDFLLKKQKGSPESFCFLTVFTHNVIEVFFFFNYNMMASLVSLRKNVSQQREHYTYFNLLLSPAL